MGRRVDMMAAFIHLGSTGIYKQGGLMAWETDYNCRIMVPVAV